ncbi:helix-turn-helix domain-containing protein, partial [Salipiger manganoxidans]
MPDSRQSKTAALAEEGTLNSAPDKVRDPKFRGSDFFDPHDIVQVKYEMLRRVLVDKLSVTEAADEYGVSRPTYYQAKANFDTAGIAGLVPEKTGPRGPRKIDEAILAFLQARLAPGEPLRARELAKLVH